MAVDQAADPKQRAGAQGDGRGGAAPGASSSVVLGPRDSLVGTLTVDGSVVVHGSLEGEVKATESIDVETPATVKAKLEGRNISVRGNVTGDVSVEQRLVVAGSGTINGDVKVSALQVEEGAQLNGRITMGSGGGGGRRRGGES